MSRRAVVVGAGLAGMLAAAVLADVGVEDVVVLDRDDLPDGPRQRRGLPQGRHAHLLMSGGLAAMEEIVPGKDEPTGRAGLDGAHVLVGAAQRAPAGGRVVGVDAGVQDVEPQQAALAGSQVGPSPRAASTWTATSKAVPFAVMPRSCGRAARRGRRRP
ncbi:hypothetical protein STENM223S_03354 [Streptomyces tendae]